jgi:hypothetical protein
MDDNEEIKKEIMNRIDKRFEIGRKEYGKGVTVDDGHDWVDETMEEILDAMIYSAAKIIQLKRVKRNNSLMTERNKINSTSRVTQSKIGPFGQII